MNVEHRIASTRMDDSRIKWCSGQWHGVRSQGTPVNHKHPHTTKPALLLDRDGVINSDHGYIYRIDQVDFLPGLFELCVYFNQRNWPIIIVTNQSGIARGYYTSQQFMQLTDWMLSQLHLRGCPIEAVYVCPDGPQIAPSKIRDYRKPGAGMLWKASAEHSIDLSASLWIGDREHDMQAGLQAGVGHCLWLDPHRAQSTSKQLQRIPAHVVANHHEALHWVRQNLLFA